MHDSNYDKEYGKSSPISEYNTAETSNHCNDFFKRHFNIIWVTISFFDLRPLYHCWRFAVVAVRFKINRESHAPTKVFRRKSLVIAQLDKVCYSTFCYIRVDAEVQRKLPTWVCSDWTEVVTSTVIVPLLAHMHTDTFLFTCANVSIATTAKNSFSLRLAARCHGKVWLLLFLNKVDFCTKLVDVW